MASHQNRLLSILAANAPSFVAGLRTVDLPQNSVLFHVNETVEHVYWPHTGVVSLVIDLEDGGVVEAAMTGFDGVCGAAFAINDQPAIHRAVTQIAGHASAIKAEALRKIVKEDQHLRELLAKYEQFVLAQAQQSAACNVKHPVHNRLARWLLRARDLMRDDYLPLTQEFLSDMLGVRRSTVSLEAHKFQESGLIKYRRGRVQVTDAQGLQEVSCECYQTINKIYEKMFGTLRPS